jgi:SAM-dependent methyltransferase
MLRQARLKARRLGLPPFRACRAQAQSLPFPDASFDSLVSTFPSEYIAEDEALVELARVLKPGGRLVIVPGGWLQPRGTKGKAMEGVARAVYGYRSSAEEDTPIDGDKALEQIAALRKSGWYHWITTLSEHMAQAGFSPSARVASNDKGACLLIVADKL